MFSKFNKSLVLVPQKCILFHNWEKTQIPFMISFCYSVCFSVIAENQYPNNKKVLTFDVEEEQLQTYYCGAREHICMSHLPQMQPRNAQQVGPPDGCLTSRTPRDR